MRICFLIINTNTNAGWGRMAFDLIGAIKGRNIETIVLSSNEPLLAHPILNFFKIRKIFKQCDIIHAIEAWPIGFWANIVNRGLKKKVIITAVGTYSVVPLYNLPSKWFLAWAYEKANAITAISDYTANEINKVLPGLKIKIIPNGVDLEKWSKKFISSEDILGLRPYILSVGGVKQRKGFRNSIIAFARIAKEFSDLKYVIVGQIGDANYMAKLQNVVMDNDLNNRVIFMGIVSDEKLIALYQNAELFILTPEEHNHHFEGFGLVYLEAAANGLPSIGSRKSGAEDAIKEGVSGLLVNQGDINGIAQVLRKILSDANLKNKFSKEALNWAKENTWDKIAKKYLNIYNS